MMTIFSLFKSILLLQMKIKLMFEKSGLLIIFCGWMESQKLKTQKLKCYVLGPKSQKFPTAENTRYTVAKHDYQESVTTWQTDRQTDTGQSDSYVPLCFAGDIKINVENLEEGWLANSYSDHITIDKGIINACIVWTPILTWEILAGCVPWPESLFPLHACPLQSLDCWHSKSITPPPPHTHIISLPAQFDFLHREYEISKHPDLGLPFYCQLVHHGL